ncbi:MAG: DUF1801 domain-containing protein [Saprospiraceae bacterium]|jgi:hypothetical protein|nr:DUF1801 domain-containing protein [Saprospiraceae bacterium]
MAGLNDDTTLFLDSLNHPLRADIEVLRHLILSANDRLAENTKWNAPNYSVGGEDRVTMRINPPKQLQLIFHRGAKKMDMPAARMIEDESRLLVWKENDRAVASFKTLTDIELRRSQLTKIIQDWLEATCG